MPCPPLKRLCLGSHAALEQPYTLNTVTHSPLVHLVGGHSHVPAEEYGLIQLFDCQVVCEAEPSQM